ncbi:hypothetical protein [Pannonibacter carbonis]|uniref:hypothetical protein n=1 Tax=Pannonibacter carbonis TaxID=2067569 RepID=UPI000D109D3D|nr:hypothetical protein [Pannonibacter carbonis]
MNIHPTPEMWVLSIAKRLRIPDIRAVSGDLAAIIEADRAASGLDVAGPWLFLSRNLPKDGKTEFDWRICLPVSGHERYGGALELVYLPSTIVASAVYLGGLRSLFTKGYRPLVQEIELSRHEFTGQSREVYHDWRGATAPYGKIEIQFELAR